MSDNSKAGRSDTRFIHFSHNIISVYWGPI